MNTEDDTELTTTEARQAVPAPMTRHVLRWGMIGAIVALFAAWLIYGN